MINKYKINYNDIDEDIRDLCRAINSINGIETIFSCSGHRKRHAHVDCMAINAKTYNKFIYCIFNNDNTYNIEFFMTPVLFNKANLNRVFFRITIPLIYDEDAIEGSEEDLCYVMVDTLTDKINALKSLFK